MQPDVIIIGGGVIGLTAARRLAAANVRVRLLERGACGREASWAGAGILSPCNPHRDDPLYHMQARSIAMFEHFCDELREETGIDPEYDRRGELHLVCTKDYLPIAESDARAGADLRMEDGTPVYQLLSPREVAGLEPAVAGGVLGGLLCCVTASVRNPRLLAALEASCRSAGVDIREETAVEDFILEGGRVCGVVARGERMPAGCVVLCAGAWSGGIHAKVGELIRVHPVRGQMLLLKADRPLFGCIITKGKTYLVPRRDGHVLVGSTEEPEAGFAKRNTPAGIAALTEAAMRMVPSLADAALEATWTGLRPGTPDNRPYLGRVPGYAGLVAATGHYRSGLTLAPATAEAVASLILKLPYDIDLSPFAPGRSGPREQ